MEFNPARIRLIVGIGNPGAKYDGTHHNIGIDFVRGYCKMYNDCKLRKTSKYSTANLVNKANITVRLIESGVYMNESGPLIVTLLRKYKVKIDGLLVVHDDSDIELGAYKFSRDSGPAGHNGVTSIISNLGTKNFWRLRIGVRKSADKRKAMNFVLRKISASDREIMEEVLRRAYNILDAGNTK